MNVSNGTIQYTWTNHYTTYTAKQVSGTTQLTLDHACSGNLNLYWNSRNCNYYLIYLGIEWLRTNYVYMEALNTIVNNAVVIILHTVTLVMEQPNMNPRKL